MSSRVHGPKMPRRAASPSSESRGADHSAGARGCAEHTLGGGAESSARCTDNVIPGLSTLFSGMTQRAPILRLLGIASAVAAVACAANPEARPKPSVEGRLGARQQHGDRKSSSATPTTPTTDDDDDTHDAGAAVRPGSRIAPGCIRLSRHRATNIACSPHEARLGRRSLRRWRSVGR